MEQSQYQNSRFRIIENIKDENGRPYERVMREETYYGIGISKISGNSCEFTLTRIKREVTREAIGERYFRGMYSATKVRVPEGVYMGRWKPKPDIAEQLGIDYFFVKESTGGRYRVELECNYNE